MSKFDFWLSAIIIGFVISMTIFLSFWWVSYFFFQKLMIIFLISGAVIGGIAAVSLSGKLVHYFIKSLCFSITVYILYMVCIFGFFMGVPVFNTVPGIIAGYYIGRRSKMNTLSYDSFQKSMRKTNILTSSILFVFMAASATIALSDKFTGANLSGMLNLQHQITMSEIVIIICIGAVLLLYVQNVLSSALGKLAYGAINYNRK
jgi:hypothetical protein